ncbi:DNA-processing protein DprA [Nesterenkonia lutea]|uniref:DNA processing protein n=1 Tax=Nesterenkonia lutea TaxID=272919 RepID=A0ABR9JCT6_9MICC|nr:DNA-processing protein DprA [Nesterenkonia lutea]MBE1523739.1 DNA processing protein [Nesterenkonia lutea]
MTQKDSIPRAAQAVPELRRIRAELSRLIEPGDLLAGVAVELLGAEVLHDLITSDRVLSRRQGAELAASAASAGLGPRQQSLAAGLQRWRTRRDQLHGQRDIDAMARFSGGILIPEDPDWPAQLRDLGPASPVALWFRAGEGLSDRERLDRLPTFTRAAAIVGSREITDYGIRITAELTEELVQAGLCLISGGAYGVDAAAHRAALRSAAERRAESSGGHALSQPHRPTPTIAVLAGGLDRLYPAGNEGLLQEVSAAGMLLSEMAPGSAPTRHRFLQRNRLIAALGMITVVTEARWRSGAQSTAHHALTLGRPVGVVPGSVFSASSSGCHRLLKETPAQVVTDAADVLALAGGLASVEPAAHPVLPMDVAKAPGRGHPQDGLTEAQRLLYDALPVHGLSSPAKLSGVAGLPLPKVLAELSRLQRSGRARTVNGQWGRAPAARSRPGLPTPS